MIIFVSFRALTEYEKISIETLCTYVAKHQVSILYKYTILLHRNPKDTGNNATATDSRQLH